MNYIKKITEIRNIHLKSKHNKEYDMPIASLHKIEFKNGNVEYIDLKANLNISVADYIYVEKTNKTKEKVIFDYIPLTEKN